MDFVTQPLDVYDPQNPTDLQAYIHEMERRYMRAIPIETQIWQQKEGQSETLLSASLTDFDFVSKPSGFKHLLYSGYWFSGSTSGIKTTMILPNKVLQLHTNVSLATYPATSVNSAGDLVYDTDLFTQEKTISHYDQKGNVLDIENRDDIPVAVIYDSEGAMPLAKVANAMHNDIAYSSFEYNDGNSWSYPATYKHPYSGENLTTHTKTGDGYYLMSSATDNKITKTGLDASKDYIVSFWAGRGGISGTIKVNSQEIETTIPNDRFQYYEVNISNVTSVEISFVGTGNFHLDELRLHPVEARMSTYTYKDLIGASSATDANNHSAYQEYDNNERLSLVRDQDKNIVKKYSYQYLRRNEPVWVDLDSSDPNNIRCQIDNVKGPTGYIEKKQKDENPYSPTYNQFQWAVKEKNLDLCEPCVEGQKWFNNVCNNPTGEVYIRCEPVDPEHPEGPSYRVYCYTYSDGTCDNEFKVFSVTPCE